MKLFNHTKILTIAILAVCLLSIGFVGAASASVSADFSITPGSGAESLSATATATAATGVDYAWTCTGGTVATPDKKETKITFTKAGTYSVVLKVTNSSNDNDNETSTKEVTVVAPSTSKTSIGTVEIDLTAPVTDAAAPSSATATGTGVAGTATVTWSPAVSKNKFAANTTYTATITLNADENHKFTDTTKVTIKGVEATSKEVVSEAQLRVTKEFTKTGPAEEATPMVNSFNANPTSGKAPLTVEFTYSIKDMNSGTVFLMQGTKELTHAIYPANSKITYTFNDTGSYNVHIKVVNEHQKTADSTDKTITVTNTSLIKTLNLNIAEPVLGATPATASQVTGTGVTCTKIEWSKAADFNTVLASSAKFEADTTYYARVTLTNAQSYLFDTTAPIVTVNGKTYGSSNVIATLDTDKKTLLVVLKCFDKTSGTITSVDVNVTAPATGSKPADATESSTAYSVEKTEWYKKDATSPMSSSDTFEQNTAYTVKITLKPASKYQFDSSLNKSKTKINGKEASDFKSNSDKTVTISYTFGATTKLAGPSITFSIDPTKPKIPSNGDKVTITYKYSISGNPTSSTLYYGDGESLDLKTQTSGTVTHDFTTLGSFKASLTSKNVNGTETKDISFSVSKDSLDAQIEVSKASGAAPLTVTLKDKSTGAILTRTWNFGDGSPTSSDATVTHTFTKPDTYTIKLTVSDGKDVDTAIQTITVTAAGTDEKTDETKKKTNATYEPFITVGGLDIPSPFDIIAEFVRLFQSMFDFDNYHVFGNATDGKK